MIFILFLLKKEKRKNKFNEISIITPLRVAKLIPKTPKYFTNGTIKISLINEETKVEIKLFLLKS